MAASGHSQRARRRIARGARLLGSGAAFLIIGCSTPIGPGFAGYSRGSAVVYGSALVTVVGEKAELRTMRHRNSWIDVVDAGAHFELQLARPRFGAARDLHTLKLVPGEVTPFVVALPPGRYAPISVGVKTSDSFLSFVASARLHGYAFVAAADHATYIGRIVIRVPRMPRIIDYEPHSLAHVTLLDAEAEDRAVVSERAQELTVPFVKRLMGSDE